MILDGYKDLEVGSYVLGSHGGPAAKERVFVIETPGPSGAKSLEGVQTEQYELHKRPEKARIIGIVSFDRCDLTSRPRGKKTKHCLQ